MSRKSKREAQDRESREHEDQKIAKWLGMSKSSAEDFELARRTKRHINLEKL